MGEFLLLGLVLVGVGGYFLVRASGKQTYHVNMLVDVDPNRALLAARIASQAERHSLEVGLSSQPYGSLDAIELVDLPNPIDLALVPGGVARREYANVRQVVALALEPLQLLTRADLAATGVSALKGRRVCLGPSTSSLHFLARDVLAFAGLHPPDADRAGDYVAEVSSPQELAAQLDRIRGLSGAERDRAVAKLPDAVFVLSALPSLLARDLVALGGYRLVSLPFADAYCLDRIRPTDAGEVRIDRASFTATDLPAYTYHVDPPVPAEPCRTIATPLLLVAYAPTEAEGIARLLETIYDGPIAGLARPLPLRGQVPQFPFHAGTERYQRRSEPLLTPEMLSGLGKAAGGLGAFVSGVVALYGFLRLRQLRRFEAYYQEIRHLELIARGQETDPAAPAEPAARRMYLEDRLLDLKSRALQDFANGGLKGEGLMSGIVSLVNDTRSSLARLTPHDGPAARGASPVSAEK
jgi:hypothetical protein